MIDYRITKADDKILTKMWLDNRQLIQILNEKMYWSKIIKATREVKIETESPEYKEFIKAYRELNNKGSYDSRIVSKYHKAIKETPHKEIMENLRQYKLYLEVSNKLKYALQVWTYLNRNSYKDTWDIVEDMSKKFVNDIFKEKELNSDEISYMNTEISAYELKHKKEVTDWVVRNIIEVRLNK